MFRHKIYFFFFLKVENLTIFLIDTVCQRNTAEDTQVGVISGLFRRIGYVPSSSHTYTRLLSNTLFRHLAHSLSHYLSHSFRRTLLHTHYLSLTLLHANSHTQSLSLTRSHTPALTLSHALTISHTHLFSQYLPFYTLSNSQE